jgi:hypothetical protein
MASSTGFPFTILRPQAKNRVWVEATADTPHSVTQASTNNTVVTIDQQSRPMFPKVTFNQDAFQKTQKTIHENLLHLVKHTQDLSQDEIDSVVKKLRTSEGELTRKASDFYGCIQEILIPIKNNPLEMQNNVANAIHVISTDLKPSTTLNVASQKQNPNKSGSADSLQRPEQTSVSKQTSTTPIVESNPVVEHWERVSAQADQTIKDAEALLKEMAAKFPPIRRI